VYYVIVCRTASWLQSPVFFFHLSWFVFHHLCRTWWRLTATKTSLRITKLRWWTRFGCSLSVYQLRPLVANSSTIQQSVLPQNPNLPHSSPPPPRALPRLFLALTSWSGWCMSISHNELSSQTQRTLREWKVEYFIFGEEGHRSWEIVLISKTNQKEITHLCKICLPVDYVLVVVLKSVANQWVKLVVVHLL
jgi:hypothetical protein